MSGWGDSALQLSRTCTARSKSTQLGDYKDAQRFIERINDAESREDMRKIREAETELDRLDRELDAWFRSEGL